MRHYFKKRYHHTKRIIYTETLFDFREHLWAFIGSFLGIGLIGFINSFYLNGLDNFFLIGSFGASSVLIYGIINSPLAQPRNLIGGHVLSAFIGVLVFKLFGCHLWLSCALSVSLSIVLMQVTKTLHPPGGATALIANLPSAKIQALGFLYVFSPVLTGVIVLLLVAVICNNTTPRQHYPSNKHWFKFWRRRY